MRKSLHEVLYYSHKCHIYIRLKKLILFRVTKMLTVWLNKYLERDFFFHDKGNRLFDQLLKFLKYVGESEYYEQANKLKLLILKV